IFLSKMRAVTESSATKMEIFFVSVSSEGLGELLLDLIEVLMAILIKSNGFKIGMIFPDSETVAAAIFGKQISCLPKPFTNTSCSFKIWSTPIAIVVSAALRIRTKKNVLSDEGTAVGGRDNK